LHLLQRCCVEFRFGKVLALRLVGDTGITDIRSSVDQLLASRGEVPSEVTRKAGFEFKESSLVVVDIHRLSDHIASSDRARQGHVNNVFSDKPDLKFVAENYVADEQVIRAVVSTLGRAADRVALLHT
jgi:hypothetical protein